MASKFPQGKEFGVSHSGQSAIICGSAPCLFKEFEEAKSHMPDAKVFVINESAWGVWGDFLVSYHAEKFDIFKEQSLNPDIVTMTGKGYRNEYEEAMIDYRFDEVDIGATSVGDAMQIATLMGFSDIVIVGAPMNGCDGYYNKTSKTDDGCPRFGSDNQQESNQVNLNKAKLAFIAPSFPNVKSMSGYSKSIFGGPSWQIQT